MGVSAPVSCAHLYAIEAGCEAAFTVDASRITFGAGCLAEVGARARTAGITRAALFTDSRLRALQWFEDVARSLRDAAIEIVIFDDVAIEPTDASFEAAAAFARDANVDGYISLGGGSVIDTAKAANLYATYPAPLRTYVNAPVGDARPVPGKLAPHIACPTTCGTGSEVTGIAIFDWLALEAKTGIASPYLRPTEALVDPRVCATLPASVVAASGMDVLSHALESFTAKPFTSRPVAPLGPRPMSQGANPWSDLGCREALRILGAHLVPAVDGDTHAREQVMWAATLAGIAFGNSGVHVPHAMAYAVAGRVRDYRAAGYPDAVLVPHGMAVAVNAPSVFRRLAHARDAEAAALLGGTTIETRVIELMRAIGIPNGVGGVGYTAADIPSLVAGTLPQQRLLANAPIAIDETELFALFEHALCYW
jgi:hydroxyacid-oxoacid transhydrogenase